jgi:hypothetical protein
VIEFLCPNGHRIRCQPEQAGRAAKCPRCGVKFRVPKPTDLDVSEAVGSDSKILRPEFVESMGSSRRLPAIGSGMHKELQIEFLCPKGHRLHGSANLQGRPGQCPECGSRFRIPTYEDISAEEQTETEINLGRINGREGSDAVAGRGMSGHAMAALVARLWDARPTDGVIELRLRDGQTVVPHEFLRKLSQQHHQGVFAVKESDGSLSLVAVAWDAVAMATLRGLRELPKGLAE